MCSVQSEKPVETKYIESQCNCRNNGRFQNTVPIASTQAAIKGIVQYSTELSSAQQLGD